MKKFLSVFFLILVLFVNQIYAKNIKTDNTDDFSDNKVQNKTETTRKNKKENADKKMSDYIDLNLDFLSSVQVGIIDSNDNDNEINITMAKNKPEFVTEADAFAKLLIFRHNNIIFGPTAYSKITGKMDHRTFNTNNSGTKKKEIFFFEEGEFFNYAGIKIGTSFGKTVFAGSKFTMTIPFLVNFIVNDTNGKLTVPDNSTEFDYFSHLLLGTNLIAHLQLKSKPFHFSFEVKNSLAVSGDVFKTSSERAAYKYLFLTSKNTVAFKIKPFNFINNKIDIEISAYFRNIADFTGENLELKKRTYLGIRWDGLKYFALGYKPFIYNDETDYLFDDVTRYQNISDFVPYYNYYRFSTEVSVAFGNQYFNVEIAYEPTYYCYDGTLNNTDSVREHTITTTVEITF